MLGIYGGCRRVRAGVTGPHANVVHLERVREVKVEGVSDVCPQCKYTERE